MMKISYLTLLPLIFPSTSHSQIYKCTDHNGNVTFSQVECSKYGIKDQSHIKHSPVITVRPNNSELEKLTREERKLSNLLTIAEIDKKKMGNPHSRAQAQEKIDRIEKDLNFVREQIMQIKDPEGYRSYLSEKNKILKETLVSEEIERANAEAERAKAEANSALNEAERARREARRARSEADWALMEADSARSEAERAKMDALHAE